MGPPGPWQEDQEGADVGGLEQALIILAVPAVLVLAALLRSHRVYRRDLSRLERLTTGQEVITTCGLFARVVGLEDGVVVLETAPGQTSRWDARAVARILDPSDAPHPSGAAPAVQGDRLPQDEPPSSATPPTGP